MTDKTVTTFPKVGNETSRVRAAGDPSPNLKSRPRGGSKSGAPVGTKSAAGRTNIQERLGAKYAPQMTMSAPQAPEAGSTGKNVRILPSAVGNRDFYLRRQYGQTGDFG